MTEAKFRLLYTQHGGSGLSVSPQWVDDLPWGDLTWWLERLEQERRREYDAQKAAAKVPKRGKRG